MTAWTNNLYHIRQTGLIDPALLRQKPIGIIGAGGIGSWTTLALLKMGCEDVTVFDFDTVEEHNVGSQLYYGADVGRTKVEALYRRLEGLSATLPKTYYSTADASSVAGFEIVVCAVDSIETRTKLFADLCLNPGAVKWLVDGRMAGNAIEIYPVNLADEASKAHYSKTLFADNQSRPIPCSEKAVIYNTFVIAGLIADVVAKIAKGEAVPNELFVDLKNFSMFT